MTIRVSRVPAMLLFRLVVLSMEQVFFDTYSIPRASLSSTGTRDNTDKAEYLGQDLSTCGTRKRSVVLWRVWASCQCQKGFKTWQRLTPAMEGVCCRCIIIPTTDSALCSFLEDSRTVGSLWTV